MAFEPGISGNPQGRPKGSKTKSTVLLRDAITNFLDEGFETVKNDFHSLKPRERVRLYCDLLQFGLPKLQSVELNTEFDRMTDAELIAIIEGLRNNIDQRETISTDE